MPEGGGGTNVPRTNDQIAATRAQVDEVVVIMQSNIQNVLERDQKLSELDARADALQQGASQFEQQTTRIRQKYWWENMKMMVILIAVILIIITIIGLSIWLG